ncbi:hypothetical protein [Fulvimarina endophytica]|nr:hypothetical protein [Fulvimarina endophytica]
MTYALTIAMTAMLLLSGCSQSNFRAATALNSDETPSDGIVPGQVAE